MKAIELLYGLCLGLVVIAAAALPAFYLWMRSSHDIYMWVISGPFPFSHMGSGPFLLWTGLAGLVAGAVLIGLALVVRRAVFR